ncbi:MAG: leucine-rich repeat domain-containing protein [Clostridia bacterium]|nr:leucine-rich repeat domain-containing protein [Clostridia bacterium]
MKKLLISLTIISILCLAMFDFIACKDKQQHKHTLDSSSGFCTNCDAPINATQGVLYKVSENGTYAEVNGYEGVSTKVNIAKVYNDLPVTGISDYAFEGCRMLMRIIIPDSVTSIGDSAFYNCDSLETVTFGETSQLDIIGSYGFYDCDSLTSIVIPANVTSIGRYAFFGCDLLISATFKNPNGWWYSNYSTATSGTSVSSSSLSNTSIAAGYLSSTYYWKRS